MLGSFEMIYEVSNSFLQQNTIFVVVLIFAFILIYMGLDISTYKLFENRKKIKSASSIKFLNLLDKLTSTYPIGALKKNIVSDLTFIIVDDFCLKFTANLIVVGLFVLSTVLVFLFKSIGQVWYVKVLIWILATILPYYVTALIFDKLKHKVDSEIPRLIDEFRSAFIEHQKIRPALKQSSLYIGGGLGKIIAAAADSAYPDKSLQTLRDKFNNVWFSIFVSMITNFKENGGEIIDQLYKLNSTMTRYINLEKKKNKRLILYEVFAVMSSLVSIPVVFWINRIVLGNDGGAIIDLQSNIIIGKIIGFSILALVVIRVLRRT